jgi:hypothetical protein
VCTSFERPAGWGPTRTRFILTRLILHSSLLSQSLEPLVHQLGHHLLQDGKLAICRPLKVSSHALLDVLANLVHLDVDIVARLLACSDDLFLSVRNQHHLPPPLWPILHLGNRKAGSINRDVALLDNVAQHGGVAGLEAEGEGVAVGRHRQDGRNGIDVALDKVAAHARVCRDGALEVDLGALLQRPQVGPAERLGSYTNLERRLVKLGDGQTRAWQTLASWLEVGVWGYTIDADAVAHVRISQNILRI